jgi:hypothetical protein
MRSRRDVLPQIITMHPPKTHNLSVSHPQTCLRKRRGRACRAAGEGECGAQMSVSLCPLAPTACAQQGCKWRSRVLVRCDVRCQRYAHVCATPVDAPYQWRCDTRRLAVTAQRQQCEEATAQRPCSSCIPLHTLQQCYGCVRTGARDAYRYHCSPRPQWCHHHSSAAAPPPPLAAAPVSMLRYSSIRA